MNENGGIHNEPPRSAKRDQAGENPQSSTLLVLEKQGENQGEEVRPDSRLS